jgi:hypothetical protein
MVVELFIRTLDRIIVPVLEMPLSALVVAQGCALLFLIALYLLIRCGQDQLKTCLPGTASRPWIPLRAAHNRSARSR